MSEETRMILKMVDEGKITPEQAVEMLKAVGNEDPCFGGHQNEHRGDEFVQEMDKWGKEFAQKMGSTVKDLEPKIRKMVQIMVQNTVKTVEEVGKVFREQREQGDQSNDQFQEDEENNQNE